MTNNIDIDGIAKILRENDNYLIIAHTRPDGDTLGSTFGLMHALRVLGKTAHVVCSDTVATRLRFLTGNREELSADGLSKSFTPGFIIAVDIATPSLLGDYEERFSSRIDLKIDHHSMGSDFAALNYTDGTAAACGEIVFDIVKAMGAVCSEASYALFAAISSDTGCFKYRNVTRKTHLAAAELIELGVPHAEINSLLYENKPLGEIVALRAVLNSIKFVSGGKIAVVTFTNEMKKQYGVTDEDINDISSIPREIEGVELGIVIKQNSEEPDTYKISMRSGKGIAANELCAAFGGGGHAGAAGAPLTAPVPAAAEKTVIDTVLTMLNLKP